MSQPAGGLLAEFESPEGLVAAVRDAREAGYRQIDAFSPYPIRAISHTLGVASWLIPAIGAAAALGGAAIQYFIQYWMNVVDYPINVGGRPLDSWPAFLISSIIVLVLWGAIAAFVSLLLICRLPRLNHPVFDVPGFERASDDRFFLLVASSDPLFDARETVRFLEDRQPCAIHQVPE